MSLPFGYTLGNQADFRTVLNLWLKDQVDEADDYALRILFVVPVYNGDQIVEKQGKVSSMRHIRVGEVCDFGYHGNGGNRGSGNGYNIYTRYDEPDEPYLAFVRLVVNQHTILQLTGHDRLCSTIEIISIWKTNPFSVTMHDVTSRPQLWSSSDYESDEQSRSRSTLSDDDKQLIRDMIGLTDPPVDYNTSNRQLTQRPTMSNEDRLLGSNPSGFVSIPMEDRTFNYREQQSYNRPSSGFKHKRLIHPSAYLPTMHLPTRKEDF